MRPFYDQVLYDFLMAQVGKPYIWGAQSPLVGWDCSGLIVWAMRVMGQVDQHFDATAQGIFNYFEKGRACYSPAAHFGSLVFFGDSVTKIKHVGIGLDIYRMVHAGGGGPKVKTLEKAIEHDAWVKIQPYEYRSDKVAILKPFYRTHP